MSESMSSEEVSAPGSQPPKDWDELNRRANEFYAQGSHDEAAAIYEELKRNDVFVDWAAFNLGRIKAQRGDGEGAVAAFEEAIDANEDHFWAHYERVTVGASGAVDSNQSLAKAAQRFKGTLPEEFGPEHLQALEGVAHGLWDGKEFAAAIHLYETLRNVNGVGTLSRTRIVERSSNDEYKRAAAASLEIETELESWALRVLSDYYRNLGARDRELHALKRYRQKAPREFYAFLQLGRRLAQDGERKELNALRETGKDFPRQQRSFAEIIFHLEGSRIEAAFRAIRGHARQYGEMPKFPGIRIAYGLADAGQDEWRDQIVTLLTAFHGADEDVMLVRINALVREQNWIEAKALFDAHLADHASPSLNVRMLAIDLFAYSGKIDKAVAMLKAERVDGVFPPRVVRAAIRIFSEVGEWDVVVDIGLQCWRTEESFEHVFAPVIRGARKTGRVRELYDAMASEGQALNRAQHNALEALYEDLSIELGPQGLEPPPSLELSAARQIRIDVMARAGLTSSGSTARSCVFFCVDKGYLAPGFASLASLALRNFSLSREIELFVLAEADVYDDAKARGEAITKRLDVKIKVYSSDEIISDGNNLRSEYGLFTGGQSLSLAAYYRIFFARYLIEHFDFSRMLYIDSDTLIRKGLANLLSIEMDTPLMARTEEKRPEVEYATKLHGLKKQYFNSGVLLIDTQHPDTVPALERAIQAALDPSSTLVFQDQCALNIGFDGLCTALPERFNYYIKPTQPLSAQDDEDAVIMHFIDRPKPWDSLYRPDAAEWLNWYEVSQTLTA